MPSTTAEGGVGVGVAVGAAPTVTSRTAAPPSALVFVWSTTAAAVLEMVPSVSTVTTMSTLALSPLARSPRSQVTVPEASSQVPWLGVAET